jgi:outer membrane protein with beta-barrel domain
MVKKVLPFFAVAVAFALSMSLYTRAALAQNPSPAARRAAYGLVAGINFANVGGADAQGSKTRTALVAGGYAAWPMADGFSFQPSLLYSMEGAKTSGDVDLTVKLNYIRLPAMLRYTWPGAGTTRPFVALGPSFGYQLTCDVSGSNNGVSASASCDAFAAPEGSQRKKFDVSGRVEAGLDFAMSGRKFTIGGAYSHGFTDVVKEGSVKNRVFSVLFGIGL